MNNREQVFENFDPVNTKLRQSINLIEASAGTGKTYAIAMLVLRFVVEQDLDIKEILVVTFTKAATEELKERIRKRLVEARQMLLTPNLNHDKNLSQWIAQLNIEPQLSIQRLNMALLDIDQASILTIHGFCQRILSEHALQSGQLFDCELTGDVSTIKQSCADDFWRNNLYTCCSWEAALLTKHYQTPEQLLASVDFIPADLNVIPEAKNLPQCFIDLRQYLQAQTPAIINTLEKIKQAISQAKFKTTFVNNFNENSQNIIRWLNIDSTTEVDFSIFTETALVNALNGNKFRKSQKNPLPSDQQKVLYIQSLELDTWIFETINTSITTIQLSFRKSLLETLWEKVDKQLEQQGLLSFDYIISRLDTLLRDEQGQVLVDEIRHCYQVALIDEFQDTDEKQWFIISSLFHSTNHYLYLIGDPKQAIYKFRGADIHSYFVAQQQAQHLFTLNKNWRSHPRLVDAINTIFNKPQAFYSQQLNYHLVYSALNADQGEINCNEQTIPPLVLWQIDKGESDYWTAGKASVEIQKGVVNDILYLLSTHFNLQQSNDLNVTTRAIRAKDIAILVRSNAQAEEFQQALNAVNIVAVINSKTSIFSATEATDLYRFLQAVAQPTDSILVKQALALSWFNLNGQQLFEIFNHESEYDAWVSRFQDCQLLWQRQGLMAMMRHILEAQGVFTSLSITPLAERAMTNLQQLMELVQQAIIDEHLGMNKTLDWLASHIALAKSNKTTSDEQLLRLESDEDAIKIITMHSAKGLEFPIVFCPFLWQRGNRLKQENQVIKCYKDGQMIADLGSAQFEQHRSLALEEQLAEDIRIFYVAVTRAKYRCYINWADVRSKEKPNDSAMAYLFDCADGGFVAQQTLLKTYALNQPDVFEYRLLATEQRLTEYYQSESFLTELDVQKKQRVLYTTWQMSSYTALSSLSIQEHTELPEDKAREAELIISPVNDQQELPRGAHTGNVIHDLLENISFSTLAENKDIMLQRDQACLRYGLKTDMPELLNELLNHTVSTFFSTEESRFSLRQLNQQDCLKEMPFYLSVKKFNVDRINAILKDCATFQPLSEKTISGYLTGFIDLICCHQGKYYVIDYKSNYLVNYQTAFLVQAMREHNYGLQYWIYSLVLHQYLSHKLENYSYEKHFGGVKYLFVRGMNKHKDNSAVYQTKPELNKIQQLLTQLMPEKT